MSRFLWQVVLALFLVVSATTQAIQAASYFIAPPFFDANGEILQVDAYGGVSFDFQLTEQGDQFYVDFPLRRGLPADATSFVVEARLEADGFISGTTLHVRTGMEWRGVGLPIPLSQRSRVAVPLHRLRDDLGELVDFSRADRVRFSIWSGEPNVTGRLVLYRVQVRRDQVAIANTGDSVALARCRALFDAAGIPYAEIGADFSEAENFKLVALPEVSEPFERARLANLRKAVNSGSRFIVFYSGSRELGALVDIEPGVWIGATPGAPWRAILPNARVFNGFSDRIPHVTENIIPPYAQRKAEVAAVWIDALGQETAVPACVVSPTCAWFAHLPPLPVFPATEFFRRICLHFVPDLAEGFAVTALMENAALLDAPPSHATRAVSATIAHAVETRQEISEIPRLCMKLRDLSAREQLVEKSPPGEIRAVWDSQARFRSTAERGNVLNRLSRNGINTIFAFAGDAQSASNCQGLETFVERAHSKLIQLHVWIYALALDASNIETRKQFAREKRLMISETGSEHAWLCPLNAKNRSLLIETAMGLVQRGVDGVHLDYMRLPDEAGCLCGTCKAAFEAHLGASVQVWPADVIGGGKQASAFRAFQTAVLTQLVADIVAAVRQIRPGMLVSAAIFPESVSAAALRQNWPEWLREGGLDFVCPMIYQADTAVFASQLERTIAASGKESSVILPGIGTTADMRGPDAFGSALQISESRRHQCRGFAFFSLDDYLIDSILPVLDLKKNGSSE